MVKTNPQKALNLLKPCWRVGESSSDSKLEQYSRVGCVFHVTVEPRNQKLRVVCRKGLPSSQPLNVHTFEQKQKHNSQVHCRCSTCPASKSAARRSPVGRAHFSSYQVA
eukprot:1354028-Pyramimonas_sp.AAC.2